MTLLYVLIGSVTVVCGALALRQKPSSPSHQLFALATVGILAWMVALYGGFHFVTPETKDRAVLGFRWAFAAGVVYMAVLSAFIHLFPRPTFIVPRWLLAGLGAFTTILFFLTAFTPVIYADIAVIIEARVAVEDHYGSLYGVFLLYTLLHYGIQIGLVRHKLRELEGIEKQKLLFAATGLFAFLFLAVFTNAILPLFGGIVFQREAVAFGVCFLIPTLYAIRRYRFLDIQLTLSRTLRKAVAFGTALGVGYGVHILSYGVLGLQLNVSTVLTSLAVVMVFLAADRLLHSSYFYRLFGYSDVEFFIQTLREFRERSVVHIRLEQLRSALEDLFQKQLQVTTVELVLRDEQDVEDPSPLSQYLQQSAKPLVTREMRLQAQEKATTLPFADDLSMRGEICLPLFHTSGQLIGFLTLGKKGSGHLYSSEELDVLEHFARFLSLTLTGILYNLELHREVDEKTAAVREMLRQQSDFVTVTAHELRTPLSIVQFQYEELYDRLRDDPELGDEAEAVQQGVQRLSKVAEKLLTVQEYDSGRSQLNLTVVKAQQFFTDMYDLFKPLMKPKQLTFQLENALPPSFEVALDTARIQTLLEQLIQNAIHFTPECGQIVLSAQEEDVKLFFSVSDSGPGVPKKHRRSIFQRFRVGDALQAPGTGLGLYICQKIAELHRGRIWAERSGLGGARFCVRVGR